MQNSILWHGPLFFFFFFWLFEGSFLRRPEGEKLNEAQQVNVCFFFIELEF